MYTLYFNLRERGVRRKKVKETKREVSPLTPNREWHYCQLSIPSQSCWLDLSVFMSLFSKLGAEEDESCAAVCGDQPVTLAHHVGTVCPLVSFPWTQQADSGWRGKHCCGQGMWGEVSKENCPNGVFIWGREPHTKTAHIKKRALGHEEMNSNSLGSSNSIKITANPPLAPSFHLKISLHDFVPTWTSSMHTCLC